MVNVDGSKRIWKQPEIKDIFEKCGAKKPDKATWGDVQYVFAMYYSDGFPKVFKCENELVKATLMYLDDPDAPEGVAFIRWLAVQDYLGEKINWKDLNLFFQYQARCDFNVSGFYFNSYCFILNLINS